jgi:NAD(P)-dependent dehydrogenase (short-subunit alcohol dehydrogenase family)
MMTQTIALVTGGSRGLGRNAVMKLAQRGVDTIFTYRSQRQEAEEVVSIVAAMGQQAIAIPLDVADCGAFAAFGDEVARQLRERWARENFDYLLNNAGFGEDADYAEASEALFDRMLNVHFKGPFFLTQQLLPLIKDGGRILNVSSGLTRFVHSGKATYAAMKGAMEVLTRYQAQELGSRGISVNIIAPGAIATDFGGGVVRDNPQVNQAISAITALGRPGLPDDIGDAIAALLSDDLAWMNGQRIEVSGGMHL